MKFVIRDDDLNYFSQPSDIERWYGDIFQANIPVGFSTIPFVKPASDVYTTSDNYQNKEYSIGDNHELVSYIRNNPLIEIMQHGCTHETVNGLYEYASNDGLFAKTQLGKELLEKSFGCVVKIFVPPHDWISRHGVLAIEQSNLDIIRGRGAGLRHFIVRWLYLENFIKMLIFRFPKYFGTPTRVYPHILDFGFHKEMCSYRIEDGDIFSGLNYSAKANGNFVVVLHLHSFTPEKKILLWRLIKQAQDLGAEFVLPRTIFS